MAAQLITLADKHACSCTESELASVFESIFGPQQTGTDIHWVIWKNMLDPTKEPLIIVYEIDDHKWEMAQPLISLHFGEWESWRVKSSQSKS